MNEATIEHEVTRVETPAPAVIPGQVTPMALIERAMASGASMEQLEKLLDLQERWEKNEARKAFAAAMVEFKKEPITINKNKGVAFDSRDGSSRTEYRHATLDHVCEEIVTALNKHGIAHSWKPETVDGKVRVTCILRHSLGHEESVMLDAPPDDSGKKNKIQAVGSTITYLERYSLLAVTGLAVKGQDDDGTGSAGLSEGAYADHEAAIDSASDQQSLDTAWAAAAAACFECRDQESHDALRTKAFAKAKEFKAKKLA